MQSRRCVMSVIRVDVATAVLAMQTETFLQF